MKKDKSLILNSIKSHYNFKSDAEFARFLGIAPNTLSNWYSRNTLDFELIHTKCVDIDGNWLLSNGVGAMSRLTNLESNGNVSDQNLRKGLPLINQDVLRDSNDLADFDDLGPEYQKYSVPLNVDSDFLIKTIDTAMAPTYNIGDVLICKLIRKDTFIQWGRIYTLYTKSQGLLVKRLFEHEKLNYLICKSDNDKLPNFDLAKEEIKSIAMVLGAIKLD